MQTARVGYSIGKWILRDGFGECVESEDVNMRLETTPLVDLGGKLLGKTGEVLFGALTYGVATLNICPYLPRPNAFEGGNKFLHRKQIVATDIDTPEKGDVCVHSDRTRVHVIRRPTIELSRLERLAGRMVPERSVPKQPAVAIRLERRVRPHRALPSKSLPPNPWLRP